MRFNVRKQHNEQGNVLFIVFTAIVLIAALSIAIQGSNRSETASINKETALIKLTAVQKFASDIERGILFILGNGMSENDIRFAHPNAPDGYGDLERSQAFEAQVFHPQGGGATYRFPPKGINDGSAYEFYGGTAAPSVGSRRADLMVVLPNVSQTFCDAVNQSVGLDAPADTGAGSASGGSAGGCVHMGEGGRFGDNAQFYDDPNTMDEQSFRRYDEKKHTTPSPMACVTCSSGERHFYYTILAR